LEVLNAKMDGPVFEIEVENLGTAKAIAIRAELVQKGEIVDVDVDNELKPDKQSTLRYTNFKKGPAILKLRYLDEDNVEYTQESAISVPADSADNRRGPGGFTIFLFLVIAAEGYVIYRYRKK